MRCRALAVALVLQGACTKSSPPPESATRAAPTHQEALVKPASGSMWHHFWDVALARDSLIRGDVDLARSPLLRLARDTQEQELPADWLPWVAEMRAQAQKAEQAGSLRDMASVLTMVSAQCAECHRATRGGPSIHVDSIEYGQHRQRGLEGVMARHAWAADELWVGMTVPNYSSWVAGARALGEFPLPEARAADGGTAAEDTLDVDPSMRARLEAVRALGKQAEAAGKPFEQTAVYTDLLVLCGECHRTLPTPPTTYPELSAVQRP